MAAEVKISSKYRIEVPREIRQALKLKPGDTLLFLLLGKDVVVLRKPKSFARALKGLGKGLYPKKYLEKERNSWR